MAESSIDTEVETWLRDVAADLTEPCPLGEPRRRW